MCFRKEKETWSAWRQAHYNYRPQANSHYVCNSYLCKGFRSEEIVPAGSAGSGLARLAGSADSEGEVDLHIPDTCSERFETIRIKFTNPIMIL